MAIMHPYEKCREVIRLRWLAAGMKYFGNLLANRVTTRNLEGESEAFYASIFFILLLA